MGPTLDGSVLGTAPFFEIVLLIEPFEVFEVVAFVAIVFGLIFDCVYKMLQYFNFL